MALLPGIGGELNVSRNGNVLTVWYSGLTHSFATGGTNIATLPTNLRPPYIVESAAYLNGGYSGLLQIGADGNVLIYQQTGAARTTARASATYVI